MSSVAGYGPKFSYLAASIPNFKMMRFSLVLMIVFLFLNGVSNKTLAQNQLDADGKKTGHWVITGAMAKKSNYKPDAIYEEGEYKRSRKMGVWKRYWPNGKLKSEITYKNGRSSGDYTTYFENGQKEESGTMKGGVLTGEFEMYWPNGNVKQKKTFDELGETQGKVEYYFENGNKELEFETVDGKESGKAVWYFENGDVKQEKTFNNGVADHSATKQFERKNPEYKDPNPPVVAKGPKANGKENTAQGGKSGSQIKDGFHKLYDNAGNILMSGEFKNGNLYNGQHYIYDEFGLLDHIEVFKNGEFAGNGIIGKKDKY